MAKRKCRMTSEERAIHDEAVRLRKMTDAQLVAHVNAKEAEQQSEGVVLFYFLRWLSEQKGFGPKTMEKIDAAAFGYLEQLPKGDINDA